MIEIICCLWLAQYGPYPYAPQGPYPYYPAPIERDPYGPARPGERPYYVPPYGWPEQYRGYNPYPYGRRPYPGTPGMCQTPIGWVRC